MSLYRDAIDALRSIVIIDERVQSLAGRVDRLADEVRDTKERLIRLETVVEVVRVDGTVLRLARPTDR